ncbi:MAG: lysine biosynthesis protein LysW [Nitrososphaerales archaeon]
MTNCLECSSDLSIPSDAIDGEIVTCKDCGSSFEIQISEQGVITVAPAASVQEDWGE